MKDAEFGVHTVYGFFPGLAHLGLCMRWNVGPTPLSGQYQPHSQGQGGCDVSSPFLTAVGNSVAPTSLSEGRGNVVVPAPMVVFYLGLKRLVAWW